ncbi:MAG TPA: FecR family protein [Bacteriovoracaceae bacterium]|nr:FecR family protein [Bacteriovoracaceae bacterium]
MHRFLFMLLFLPTYLIASDATVVLVKGNVTVDMKQVVLGQVIKEGKEIDAMGPKSVIQLSFSDKSRILLKHGILKIEKPTAGQETFLRLVKGILYAQKAKGNLNFKLATANATMGVRGTKFFVSETEAESYLCVCEGLVSVSNNLSTAEVGIKEDLRVKPGEKFEKTKANDMMWALALKGFTEMI